MFAQGLARVRNPLWTAAALVVVVAGLRAGAPLLVPLLVAVFLAIILAPAVSWLARRKVPRFLAILLVVLGLIALGAGVAALVSESFREFASVAPRYQERLSAMLRAAIAWSTHMLGSRQLELSADKLLASIDPGSIVSAVGWSMNALAILLSDAVLVLLTLAFILVEAPTLPGKLRRLLGKPNADMSRFDRIANDVQRYLAVKTVLAVATGTLVGVLNALLGIDFALLWGLLGFLANYIPNLGIIFAAIPAVLLALVQYGVGRTALLVVGYVVIGTVIGNITEPAWLGRRLGLSTLVVFLSLVIWGWIWGWVGMLLSVPLTMVLKIMLEWSEEWRPIAATLDGPKPSGVLARVSLRPPAKLRDPIPPDDLPDEPGPRDD
jgi:predicted PurR-regulated permease PerM